MLRGGRDLEKERKDLGNEVCVEIVSLCKFDQSDLFNSSRLFSPMFP